VKYDIGLENTFWLDSANSTGGQVTRERERDVKSQDQLIPPHCSNHALLSLDAAVLWFRGYISGVRELGWGKKLQPYFH
jgi:hypothetical protein